MNKEEILQASRMEHQNKDLFELEMNVKAQRVGSIVALFVVFALMILDRVLLGETETYRYFLIVDSLIMGTHLYKAVKWKGKFEIFWTSLWVIITIFSAARVMRYYIG